MRYLFLLVSLFFQSKQAIEDVYMKLGGFYIYDFVGRMLFLTLFDIDFYNKNKEIVITPISLFFLSNEIVKDACTRLSVCDVCVILLFMQTLVNL